MGFGYIKTSIERLKNYSLAHSLSYYMVDLACCGVELRQTLGPRYDLERFGAEEVNSEKQANLLIVGGNISLQFSETLKNIYNQMAFPKYVIAVGSCAISAGPFQPNLSPNTLAGVDKIIPVDVYVPGCPPRPEAFLHALVVLQEKIIKGKANGGELNDFK